MDLYDFVRGPLAGISLTVFFVGCLYQIITLIHVTKKNNTGRPERKFIHGLRSILFWLIPFGSVTMRKNFLMTIFTSVFHLCLFFTMIFLLAHTVLVYESWNILWFSIPEALADGLTVLIIISCIFFFIRRLAVPEVKRVTTPSDYFLLILVMLPFLAGFLAYHQWGPYKPMLILHILSGEILLITLPFSRLSHMLVFAFSRAEVGREFGDILESRDW